MPEKNANGSAELDTFLPQDNSTINGVTKYKITKGNAMNLEAGATDFDPFKARQLEHPVSDCNTLTHLLKASLGTGILSMPLAFRYSGLILGVFSTILVSIICTHCSYILVSCAHELYKKAQKTQMGFADVAEQACLRGPKWSRKFSTAARGTVLVGIFVTYFLTCSCYSVIIAQSFNYVLKQHMGYEPDIRIVISILMVPLVLLAYVPNLKYLAPFSMVANVFMAVSLGIIFYYLAEGMGNVNKDERDMVGSIGTFPVFFSITVFAIEAIGVVMPLENHMENPRHFTGLCGVLNRGMSGVTLIYILLGFVGYYRFGKDVQDSIALNLDPSLIPAQVVNVLIALAVFCTFGLQFYVCLDIAWEAAKNRFKDKERMGQYIVRTVMVVVCVALAIAVPTIAPLVSLIGAFCFSILGLTVPVMIEMLTFWEKGFGKFHWKIIKNVIVVIIAILALVFGSKDAIEQIVKKYTVQGNVTLANLNTTNSTS